MYKTGVVIVTYNAKEWITLICEMFKDEHIDVKLYVVDNNSSDDTVELIRSKISNSEIIELKMNTGFGYANNIGLKRAVADNCNYFLLLNQDAKINIESIRELRAIHSKNPEFAVLSPVHLYSSEYVDNLHLRTLISGSRKLMNDLIVDANNTDEVYEIPYTNAAIWHLTKFSLDKVGCFDPLFKHYGEDVDYCRRAYYTGMRVGVTLKVRGFHYRDQVGLSYKRNSRFYYNKYLLTLKDWNRSLSLQYCKTFTHMCKDTLTILIARDWNLSRIFLPFLSYLKLCWLWKKIRHSRKNSVFIID